MQLAIKTTNIGAETMQTVNARELHAELGVGKDFSNWVKAQVKRAGLVENMDFVVIAQKGVNPQGGRPCDEYHLTIEAGKNIAMLSGTAKGKEVRAYFIECERIAKTPIKADPLAALPADQRALVALMLQSAEIKAAQEKQATDIARIQETVAVIEARTQPENKHFTVMGYANLVGRVVDLKAASKLGKKCADLSRTQGMPIGDVRDPRFGKVHSYHESILQAVLDSTI